jgi:hypothetical protein
MINLETQEISCFVLVLAYHAFTIIGTILALCIVFGIIGLAYWVLTGTGARNYEKDE